MKTEALTGLLSTARRARMAYAWEEAIDCYSKALTLPGLSPAEAYELRDRRAFCHARLASYDAELEDLAMMAALAQGNEEKVLEALSRQALTLDNLGEIEKCRAVIATLREQAEQANLPFYEAKAQFALGQSLTTVGEFEKAARECRAAGSRFKELGALREEADCAYLIAYSASYTGQDGRSYANRVMEIARQLDDRLLLGRAYHILGVVHDADPLLALSYHERALETYQAVRELRLVGAATHNVGTFYNEHGLYKRAYTLLKQALAIREAQRTRSGHLLTLHLAALAAFSAGYHDEAWAMNTRTLQAARATSVRNVEAFATLVRGIMRHMLGQHARARELLASATQTMKMAPSFMPFTLSWLADACLATGDHDAALQKSEEAMQWLDEIQSPAFPEITFWIRYRVLQATVAAGEIAGQEAWQCLHSAMQAVMAHAMKLPDRGLRRAYLARHDQISIPRIVLDWAREAHTRGEAVEVLSEADKEQSEDGAAVAHPFKRLLAFGARLTAQAPAAQAGQMPAFILDEFVELSGAERAFLALRDEGDESLPQIVVADGIEKGHETAVFETATALIEQALLAQHAVLAQRVGDVPQGQPPAAHQRSLMVVPLVSPSRVLGVLYGDIRHIFGPFTQADADVMTMLANHAAAALENTAWTHSLEQRVAQRTEDLEAANRQLAQQNGELAVINSVQRALVARLDMQDIYELVGDQIRDIFDAQTVGIGSFEGQPPQQRLHYLVENGERFPPQTLPLSPLGQMYLEEPRSVLLQTSEDFKKLGMRIIEGTEPALSGIFVPILRDGEAWGAITLQNVDREYAFTQDDVRLLETLAHATSLALQNAHLFDEVQRKNAEITEALERETASNDILRAMAESPTDVQPVLDIIAHHAAQLSGSDDAIIAVKDDDVLRVVTHYGDVPMIPVGQGIRFDRYSVAGRAMIEGRSQQAIHNEPGVASEYPEGDKVAAEYGYRTSSAVPLMREGTAVGVITIRRTKPDLLTDKQLALVQSFANQAAIALENVRLFDETQRLLAETEARNAELTIINTVQKGLVAQMSIQAIYDLVGDQIRDIFDAQVVLIGSYDPDEDLLIPRYVVEKGERFYLEPGPLLEQDRMMMEQLQTIVINENLAQRIMELTGSPPLVPVGELPKSEVRVPLVVRNEYRGLISLQNIDREHAFSESDVSLLQTLANSMSVALENARLFEQTQRLLNETEARNAELAIINDVQSGLVAQINMEGIYELVGEEIRRIFDAQVVTINRYDLDRGLNVYWYAYEKGERLPFYTTPISPLVEEFMEQGQTSVVNEGAANVLARGKHQVVQGEMPKSYVSVPLRSGHRVTGHVSLQNIDREYAFSEADVRLLETLAASLSISLENARLFEEAQRRAREMSALAEVGRDISATLDLTTVLERIAAHARELLDVSNSAVFLPDEEDETMKARVALGPIAGQVKATRVRPGEGIIGDLWRRREAQFINDAAHDPRAVTIEGTERHTDDRTMVAPLLAGDRVTGMMAVWRSGGEAFDDQDLAFLQGLARQASIAIENARLYSEAQAATAAARAANESKSAFLANVSHELRTPLTSVMGFAHIVQRRLNERIFPRLPADDARVQRTVAQIEQNLDIVLSEGERLTALINNVLDLEKIEAGRMEWRMEEVSLADIVKQATQATSAIVEQAGLTLVEAVDPDVPPVIGDRDRLVQVMINLISNAMKFTPSGSITCRLRTGDGEALVSVQDTGVGIAPHDLDAVFEKFRQVGDTLTDKPEGTGLGLSICKEIVEHHGGRIWVESVVGEGSTFSFTVPLIGAGHPPGVRRLGMSELLEQLKERLATLSAAASNRPNTVLVADDDANVRELLHQELAAEGYEVHEAADGREALAQVRRVQPDLVILDVMMPELSGFDVAAVIRNSPETMGLPIVIVSVLTDRERGYRLGVDRYLTKPIDTGALLDEVQALLAQGASRRKVLVIDEDAGAVQTLSQALEAQGYEVTAITNGAASIEAAVEAHPDMIIIDAHLSEKLDIVQAIRFEKGLENVLFLLVQ